MDTRTPESSALSASARAGIELRLSCAILTEEVFDLLEFRLKIFNLFLKLNIKDEDNEPEFSGAQLRIYLGLV